MQERLEFDIRAVGDAFDIPGVWAEARPHGTGHINDTFAAVYLEGKKRVRYVHQRINHHVFKNPVAVMDNIERVTAHIRHKLAAAGKNDIDRRVLTLVPTRAGGVYHVTGDGNYWRTYIFIERAHIHDIVETPQQAYQSAREYGYFQKLLTDLHGPRLAETIPDFHHTPRRYAAFERAVQADAVNRAAAARAEIEFATRRRPMTNVLLDLHHRGLIPERVTHNDTKFNNVMLDDETGEGMCVLDLDTVMPGLALYDFGDMVRSTTSPSAEDERDLTKVRMELPMFEGLARGYLSTAGEFLTPTERANLACAGKLITFEIGLRFLTDFLEGDHYFKVHRDSHNLDRCRTQFKLVESIEQQEAAMNRLVEQL
jgi:hypothetical protein